MTLRTAAVLLAAALCVTSALGSPGCKRSSSAVLEKVVVATPQECAEECNTHALCASWWLHAPSSACMLYSDVAPKSPASEESHCGVAKQTLAPLQYKPLPIGSVTPSGWLRKQLVLQANGLSGHLPLFWADVENSSWIGGLNDTGLHERTPYWMNGFVPLTYLLNPKNGDPIPTDLDLVGIARRYVTYILDNAGPEGWLGPDNETATGGNQYWGPMNMLQALTQFAEANDDMKPRVVDAVIRHVRQCNKRMDTVPFAEWSAARWFNLGLTVQWLLDHAAPGNETLTEELWAFGKRIHDAGLAWDDWFVDASLNAGNWTYMLTHGVNVVQALKSAAVWYRQSKNFTLYSQSSQRRVTLDNLYGTPTGMICADEHLCAPPSNKMPSRGTELCAVVEAMYSYENMFSVFGDVAAADRTERIALNALPATFASPLGGDMWNHQYLQATNEISAKWQDPHIWPNDGPQSEMYGLAPNFGCCTANFNQGWPKFASHMFYTSDDGVVVALYAPASAKLPDGSELTTEATGYPFTDQVSVTYNAKTASRLYLRIPAWNTNAVVTVNGVPTSLTTGGFLHGVDVQAGTTTVTIDFRPEVRLESWSTSTVSMFRGPVMYSLNLDAQFHLAVKYAFESRDYNVTTSSEWRYAVVVDDLASPSDSLTFRRTGLAPNAAPFNHTDWPMTLSGKVRLLPNWGITNGSASVPPASPACGDPSTCGPTVSATFVPHGGTDLRMGALPLAVNAPLADSHPMLP